MELFSTMYSCIHATGMGVVGQISGVSEPPPDNAYRYFYVYLIFCRHVLCSPICFNYQIYYTAQWSKGNSKNAA